MDDTEIGASEKTATFVRSLEGFRGDARLYRVDPPMTDYDFGDGSDAVASYSHVVVSAVTSDFTGRPETYIFGADASGEIVGWGELPGSFQGGLDHDAALMNAGYQTA